VIPHPPHCVLHRYLSYLMESSFRLRQSSDRLRNNAKSRVASRCVDAIPESSNESSTLLHDNRDDLQMNEGAET
jgi:hypothetical protein